MAKGFVLVYVEAFVAENMLLCHYPYGKLIGASPYTYTYIYITNRFTHGYAHAREGTWHLSYAFSQFDCVLWI